MRSMKVLKLGGCVIQGPFSHHHYTTKEFIHIGRRLRERWVCRKHALAHTNGFKVKRRNNNKHKEKLAETNFDRQAACARASGTKQFVRHPFSSPSLSLWLLPLHNIWDKLVHTPFPYTRQLKYSTIRTPLVFLPNPFFSSCFFFVLFILNRLRNRIAFVVCRSFGEGEPVMCRVSLFFYIFLHLILFDCVLVWERQRIRRACVCVCVFQSITVEPFESTLKRRKLYEMARCIKKETLRRGAQWKRRRRAKIVFTNAEKMRPRSIFSLCHRRVVCERLVEHEPKWDRDRNKMYYFYYGNP